MKQSGLTLITTEKPPLRMFDVAIRVAAQGTEVDGVTAQRMVWLDVSPASLRWKPEEKRAMLDVLQDHGQHFEWDDQTLQIGVAAYDVLKTRFRLSTIPYTVREFLTRPMPLPSYDQLSDGLGKNVWDRLRPFQKVAVQRMVGIRRGYICDEMGAGKTFSSLASAWYFRQEGPILVVCPSSLRFTWKNQILNWLPVPEDTIAVITGRKELEPPNPRARKKRVDWRTAQFVIISYALLVPRKEETVAVWQQLKHHGFQVIILDECHYIKNVRSKRGRAAFQLCDTIPVVLELSGTPCNVAADLWPQIRILYPHLFPIFHRERKEDEGEWFFANRYCKPQKIMFGTRRTEWVYKGYEHQEELNALLSRFMVRRRKKDILPQLPPKNRICITLDPLPLKQIKEIKTSLKRDEAQPPNPYQFMEAFRLTSQYKIPQVVQFMEECVVEDMLKAGQKVLVFAHHMMMHDALHDVLKKHHLSYFTIDQSTPSAQRAVYEQAFQTTNQYQLALLSIKAAGTGLTLTAATTVIFTELLFGPNDMCQAEDRAHRLGQQASVNIFYLIQPDTTDDINWGMVKKKERESSTILDGVAHHLTATRKHPTALKT